jgi:hypothetical protein
MKTLAKEELTRIVSRMRQDRVVRSRKRGGPGSGAALVLISHCYHGIAGASVSPRP